MGAYIYKTMKIDYDAMTLGAIGFYEFWYKPSWASYSRPCDIKRENMREVIEERLENNHPFGMKYACYAPMEHYDSTSNQKWDSKKKQALYRVPNGGMSCVISDEGRVWEETFQLKNIVGVVWGAKGGRKHVDQSPSAIWDIIKREYFNDPDRTSPRHAAVANNNRIVALVKEEMPHVYRYAMLDKLEKSFDKSVDILGLTV